MPLGWRPDDVKHIQRYRINEKTFVKYNVEVPTTKKAFLVLQVALGLYLMSSTINLNIPFTMVETEGVPGWGGGLWVYVMYVDEIKSPSSPSSLSQITCHVS
jgi:hypothetical protein